IPPRDGAPGRGARPPADGPAAGRPAPAPAARLPALPHHLIAYPSHQPPPDQRRIQPARLADVHERVRPARVVAPEPVRRLPEARETAAAQRAGIFEAVAARGLHDA